MDRILIIAPFEIFPPYWGAANRVYNLARHLSAEYRTRLLYVSHQQLDVAGSVDDPLFSNDNFRLTGVPSFSRYSQVLNPLLILSGLVLSCRERYSLILAETGWSGLHAMLLSFLTRVPYVLDEHNVESVAFGRMGRGGRAGAFLLRLYERIICKFAQKIICVSEKDAELLVSGLRADRDKIVVAPNGVDTERFRPDPVKRDGTRRALGITENAPVILFNGKLDYKPNHEAVETIYREIMPRVLNGAPDARFLIVGSRPPPEFSRDSLVFTGTVDRIEDYINASDVVICPLKSGGGTRFKILEAVACGKRVVSTTMGAEGLTGGETAGQLTCADDWEQFSSGIIGAIHSGQDVEISEGFIEKYGWPQIAGAIKSQALR